MFNLIRLALNPVANREVHNQSFLPHPLTLPNGISVSWITEKFAWFLAHKRLYPPPTVLWRVPDQYCQCAAVNIDEKEVRLLTL